MAPPRGANPNPANIYVASSAPVDDQFTQNQNTNEHKIDYSQFEPISHKKTLTLINYFILNTSQFLNSLSNVSEKKIHDIDENLDILETLVTIFESKLDSLPEEYFEHVPQREIDTDASQQAPMNDILSKPINYVAPTEN